MDQQYGGDFFARLSRFAENVDPILLVLGLLIVLVVLGLGVFGKRKWLFQILMLSLIFSGSVFPTLDAGTSLLRWLVLAILSLTWFTSFYIPSAPWICHCIYLLIGFTFALQDAQGVGVNRSYCLQSATLGAMVALAAAACSGLTRTREGLTGMSKMCIVAATAWAIGAITSLPKLMSGELTAERVTGSTVSAPMFVITGGLLLLFTLWGAMMAKGWRRWFCIGLAVVIASCLVVSGQRTGLFGALIGSAVFLWQGSIRRFAVVAVVVVVAGFVVVQLLKTNPRQTEFLQRRYFTTDTTGRQVVWAEGLRMCLEHPILGHGSNASDGLIIPIISGGTIAKVGSFHNAFLMIWYDTGLIGLLFCIAAILITLYKLIRILISRPDNELRWFARLFLALLIALVTESMFERGIQSPSDISTVIYVFLFVLVSGLEQLVRASKARVVRPSPGLPRTGQIWLRPGYAPGTT